MEDKYNRNMFNNKSTNVFMEANQICFAYLIIILCLIFWGKMKGVLGSLFFCYTCRLICVSTVGMNHKLQLIYCKHTRAFSYNVCFRGYCKLMSDTKELESNIFVVWYHGNCDFGPHKVDNKFENL